MTSPTTSAEAHDHAHPSYVKIWAILLGLLVVSVLGPMAGIKVVTLITAFGIAIVKAYLVARHFMHLNVEPKYIAYLLATCLAFMLLLFAGVSPDVMRHDGENWTNVAAHREVDRAMAATHGPATPAAPPPPDVAFRNTCSPCHGATGQGNGAAAASLNPHPANFTDPAFWATRDRDHVARVIRAGGASVGRSALMPAFGAQFDEENAKSLADYIVTTFKPASAGAVEAKAGEAPATNEANAPATNEANAPAPRGSAPTP